MSHQPITAAIIDLIDRPIAFQRAFVALGVGVTGALMLSQAVYWSKRTDDKRGWFYKSQEEWEEETGLKRAEQETARKRLIKIGVLEEERRGLPARLFYRVNKAALQSALITSKPGKTRLLDSSNQDCGIPADMSAGKSQAGLQDSSGQACGIPAIIHTEITTETTTETLSGAENSAPAGGGTALAVVLPKQQQVDQTETAFQMKCRACWDAYRAAYADRYQTAPIRNAKVNALVKQLVQRLGEEAAPVAEFFVRSINETYVVRNCHELGALVTKAESYRTQWATGRAMTTSQARQIDSTQTNANVAEEAIRMLREREARK